MYTVYMYVYIYIYIYIYTPPFLVAPISPAGADRARTGAARRGGPSRDLAF